MRQLGDRLRLACESHLELRVLRELGGEDLHRHGPVEPRIARLLDFPHPARPDGGHDLVWPEAGAGGHRFSSSCGQLSTTWNGVSRVSVFVITRKRWESLLTATTGEESPSGIAVTSQRKS